MFHFDKLNTFCISLASNPDRWNRMERRFKELNMDVSRFTAVSDDSELNVDFAHYLSPFQKYCCQSHINLWRLVVDNQIPYALILEDDACFDIKWKEKLELFSNINDPELDAVFLNGSEPAEPLHTWVMANEQYLTGGYIITLKGAKSLLDMFSGFFYSSDWMTSRLQLNRHSYIYYPWLIIQEGKDSTICSNVEADHQKVLRCLGEIHYSLENYTL